MFNKTIILAQICLEFSIGSTFSGNFYLFCSQKSSNSLEIKSILFYFLLIKRSKWLNKISKITLLIKRSTQERYSNAVNVMF